AFSDVLPAAIPAQTDCHFAHDRRRHTAKLFQTELGSNAFGRLDLSKVRGGKEQWTTALIITQGSHSRGKDVAFLLHLACCRHARRAESPAAYGKSIQMVWLSLLCVLAHKAGHDQQKDGQQLENHAGNAGIEGVPAISVQV